NPYYDNGIKIFGHDGFKLPDTVEEHLEELILDDSYHQKGVTRDALGKAYRLDEAWARYVVFLKTVLPRELQLDGLKIVVDCAHGAAYKVAPHVFEELGAEVVALSCSPNGTNINHECGSLHPEHMCKTVVEEGADMGIALDGDADRVVMCDENGQVIDGDQLMAISALRMKRDGCLNGDTVVGTVMSNLGLENVLNGAGIKLIRTDVGDRYVVEAMRKGGYNLGGEQSGHLIFLDQTSTGDGIVAAIQTLIVMLRENRKLSELAQVMQRMPQVLVNVAVATKPPIDDIPSVASLIADVEQRLGDTGRVLVRYSGTEATARVMLEGVDDVAIRGYADEIAAALQTALAS
ncbi:MAG TPA: phosphoglucosamine mutase, partial [Myxococcales bacterium]|nr:phosphoglucosamine mutase [Myxococcales bacterium]